MKKNRILSLLLYVALSLISVNYNTLKAQSDYIAPTQPTIPNTTFNIKDFGAVGDDATDNTKAIQEAINAAAKVSGGKVIIPKGIYLSGPFWFTNNLNLEIQTDAILKMLPMDKYPGGLVEGNDFITGLKLHDIAITGKGMIDGQGSPWWPFAKTKNTKRPRMIAFRDCERVLIDGVKMINSPKFHITVGGKSSNVTVQNVTVSAPASTDPVNPSHNTDACDVSGTKILIKQCNISVGDDNFTCGGNTSDVLITDCSYGYGHGVCIGSPTKGGVSNFTVQNCTFTNTDFGIRIKTDRDRGGLVENITYRNLKMTNVGLPILIYGAYNAKENQYRNLQKLTPEIATTYPSAKVTVLTPIFRNIIFQDITATAVKGKRAGLIWGLPEANASNIILKNVNITADKPFGIFFAQNIQLVNCKMIIKEGHNKFILTNNSNITLDGKAVK